MMQKNFNIALSKGTGLLNYQWKLQPLNELLVFGNFKAFHARDLLLPSELPLCFQWCVHDPEKMLP